MANEELIRELVMDGLSERSARRLASIAAITDELYGDGADGDVVIGAGTTTLTRSMSYGHLTVSAGATLVVPTGLTLQADRATGPGVISADGQGAAHGAGATGAGVAGTAGTAHGSSTGGAGGAGGAGGTGAAGAATAPVTSGPSGLLGLFAAAGKGSGGSGGGGDGANSGGNGGDGGGDLRLFVRDLSGFTGTIVARGLVGANGAGAGNTAGGGGGGGGALDIVTAKDGAYTTAVTGGAGGLHHGTGADGLRGSPGSVVKRIIG